ncbi:hypothetical protein QBC36DRAFT_372260 [Triangularia setosa]|uniref:Uncharacterized protein n=1 Tax=Triangularia setosa TaxID=2587417 RepID=A0AAN6WG71_9PEZI|nr:hypothetical protein QBC36DRAFT_372260 [Podospora setosa]
MSFLTTNPNIKNNPPPPAFPNPAALKKYQRQLAQPPPPRAIFEHSYTIPSSKRPLSLREDEVSVTFSTPPQPQERKRGRRKGSVLERMDKIGAPWRLQMLQDQQQPQPPTPLPKTVSPRFGKMYNKKGEVIGYVEVGGGGGNNDEDAEMAWS